MCFACFFSFAVNENNAESTVWFWPERVRMPMGQFVLVPNPKKYAFGTACGRIWGEFNEKLKNPSHKVIDFL